VPRIARPCLPSALLQAKHAAVPAYQQMFARAGFPVEPGAPLPDALVNELFVYGDTGSIAARLREIHAAGVDEIMVTIHPVHDPLAEFATTVEMLGQL
jgi:alkanesulfonate monooxygenase SsuD/methylene tetrahydromethanopterin reductase-like flavin-dependent oxidoreductase (luciferase family)